MIFTDDLRVRNDIVEMYILNPPITRILVILTRIKVTGEGVPGYRLIIPQTHNGLAFLRSSAQGLFNDA